MRRELMPWRTLLILLIAPSAMTARAWAEEKPPGIRADVLNAVEEELGRLSKMAEKEAGPDYPHRSSEMAFLLVAGLSAEGVEVKEPTAEELRQLGITRSGRIRLRVFAVGEGARTVISASTIQDKSGSYTIKHATLYRLRAEKWVECGGGTRGVSGAHGP